VKGKDLKMKKIVVFSALLMSAIYANPYVAPGEVTFESFDFEDQLGDQKIASGLAGKKGENLDFCYLSINFFNKRQSCGCSIVDSNQVVTSARCVVE
jgi:hypothetical protein